MKRLILCVPAAVLAAFGVSAQEVSITTNLADYADFGTRGEKAFFLPDELIVALTYVF